MNFDLSSKVALITGGGQGVGRAIALRFSKQGAIVVVNGRSTKEIEDTTAKISEEGGKALAIRADVTNYKEVVEMVDSAVSTFGRIDILVNNAGDIVIAPFVEQSEVDWDRIMDVNVKSQFLCCKSIVPLMIKQQSGKIINISSEAGKMGFQYMVPYCAAKHAVIGLTRSLAKELAQYKINVNAICPGSVINTKMRRKVDESLKEIGAENLFTPLPPLGRFVTPEDVANIATFLASPESDFMTGQAINVTGGEVQI